TAAGAGLKGKKNPACSAGLKTLFSVGGVDRNQHMNQLGHEPAGTNQPTHPYGLRETSGVPASGTAHHVVSGPVQSDIFGFDPARTHATGDCFTIPVPVRSAARPFVP